MICDDTNPGDCKIAGSKMNKMCHWNSTLIRFILFWSPQIKKEKRNTCKLKLRSYGLKCWITESLNKNNINEIT